MWSTEYTQTTSATAQDLWQHYADPARWPEWDHEISSVTFEGALREGACGSLKPVKGPRATFTVTELTPLVSFTDTTRLPFAQLDFTHSIRRVDGGTNFTHRVAMTGPLAPLFGRLIGRTIAAELPTAMRALAALAERTEPAARPH